MKQPFISSTFVGGSCSPIQPLLERSLFGFSLFGFFNVVLDLDTKNIWWNIKLIEQTNKQTNKQINNWINKQVNVERQKERKKERKKTNEQTNKQTKE